MEFELNIDMFKKIEEVAFAFCIAFVSALLCYFFLGATEKTDSNEQKNRFFIENLARSWNDIYYKPKTRQEPNSSVVLVAIDEPSLIEIGRWPWSREIINELTSQLLSLGVKTVSFDIIFAENESKSADNKLASTIQDNSEQIVLGTFSDSKVHLLPYQDFCLTQAFLFTGGDQLVKINPFFTVIDEANSYEELPFNRLFDPIFYSIQNHVENVFVKTNFAASGKSITRYQKNSLEFQKKKEVFNYCQRWLTDDDEYNISSSSELAKLYFSTFNASAKEDLILKLERFKKQNQALPIPQYTMWRQNVESIQKASTYTASFVAHPDQDGIIRHYPLVLRTGNQLGTSFIPAMALQAFLASTGYQVQFEVEKINGEKQISSVGIYDINKESDNKVFEIPTDKQGKLLLSYYGKQNTITYVSAKDLLNSADRIRYFTRVNSDSDQIISKISQELKAEFFKDKNVIIGATAVGLYDIRTVPHDINYPGPEIHATALSNLLSQNFKKYFPNEVTIAPIFIFFIFFFFLILCVKVSEKYGFLLFASVISILILIQYVYFDQGIVFKSSLLWIILIISSYLLTIFYRYFFLSRKAKEIKKAFGKYVSKDLVEQILKNADAIELRGKKLNMSVFFSDIRGFTEFSERIDPVELAELLNKYFTPMSKLVTSNQGTIDKYIGDAIMAMFGAPVNYPNHAEQACKAALECQQELIKINSEFEKRGWPKIQIGIGINSGMMNAGNIGSEDIQNYTVIGDSVNLASRLQNLTKDYGAGIIISESTYESVKNKFMCNYLGEVNVKGKKESVRIYELVSTKKD
jgi:adenylate cyclase